MSPKNVIDSDAFASAVKHLSKADPDWARLSWSIPADHEFEFSISHHVKDIVESVQAPGGYLQTLKSDADLQDRFEKALLGIYETGG